MLRQNRPPTANWQNTSRKTRGKTSIPKGPSDDAAAPRSGDGAARDPHQAPLAPALQQGDADQQQTEHGDEAAAGVDHGVEVAFRIGDAVVGAAAMESI